MPAALLIIFQVAATNKYICNLYDEKTLLWLWGLIREWELNKKC
jgi:hypothetical protein